MWKGDFRGVTMRLCTACGLTIHQVKRPRAAVLKPVGTLELPAAVLLAMSPEAVIDAAVWECSRTRTMTLAVRPLRRVEG